jgi:hypothetical protein
MREPVWWASGLALVVAALSWEKEKGKPLREPVWASALAVVDLAVG